MNAKQENRFSMALAVLKTLENNHTVVNSLAALANARTELENVLGEISTLSQLQSRQFSAADKTQATETAIAMVLEVINAVKAYALDQDKPAIAAGFNYSKHKLDKMRDTVLLDMLKLVKENATIIITDIAPYGADAAKLAALQTATDAYEAVLAKPRMSITARSTATKEMDAAFKKMSAILEKMDSLVATRRSTNDTFYGIYQFARKVVDNKGGGKRKKEETPALPVG